ncbi:hypothetical protein PHSY_001024 [Pseudozyma hubeiensis SY62]|uniref:Secreted protein n=1 Tax=Pseudozyma hubeiensis (strain SY62) TaxID=1305764 RepID=R9NXT8_PSEHS|nr:hypothetical protein PHSY_001024 [Pseudozyma hubeiensis SY62]GAC93459.1 hypothetical protein PHSY_001024 [Pseudozyma hubeiensis SY62]
MHMTFLAASLIFFCDLASPPAAFAFRSRFCCALEGFDRKGKRIKKACVNVLSSPCSEGGRNDDDLLCAVTHREVSFESLMRRDEEEHVFLYQDPEIPEPACKFSSETQR